MSEVPLYWIVSCETRQRSAICRVPARIFGQLGTFLIGHELSAVVPFHEFAGLSKGVQGFLADKKPHPPRTIQ